MLDDAPLGFLLIDSARLLRARYDRALEDAQLGLTAGEARALLHVGLAEPSRQSALAARMGVEPMTLVGYLDRLEGCGLILREPDPSDRRAKVVRLTSKGRPLLERAESVTRAAREAAMTDFRPEEVELLRGMLARLRARLLEAEATTP